VIIPKIEWERDESSPDSGPGCNFVDSNAAERTICSTPSLLQADARMTAYFEIATQFVGMGVRGDLSGLPAGLSRSTK